MQGLVVVVAVVVLLLLVLVAVAGIVQQNQQKTLAAATAITPTLMRSKLHLTALAWTGVGVRDLCSVRPVLAVTCRAGTECYVRREKPN